MWFTSCAVVSKFVFQSWNDLGRCNKSSYLGVLAIYKFEDPQPTKGPWPAWVVVTCSIQKTGSKGNRSDSWRWHPSLPQSQVNIRQWGQRLCSQKYCWRRINQARGNSELCFVMTCFHSLFNQCKQPKMVWNARMLWVPTNWRGWITTHWRRGLFLRSWSRVPLKRN